MGAPGLGSWGAGERCLRWLLAGAARESGADFKERLAGLLAVAQPEAADLDPLIAGLEDREPRSAHKVGALESQADPQVVEADAFDRPADLGRLEADDLLRPQVLLEAEGNAGRSQAEALDPALRLDDGEEVRIPREGIRKVHLVYSWT